MTDLYKTSRDDLVLKGDRNFCVPLAISIVSGVDVDTVNQVMFTTPSLVRGVTFVRAKGRGVYSSDWTRPELLEKFGISFVRVSPKAKTVKTLVRELPSNQRYVVKVRRHALAIRHGKVQDWTEGRAHRVMDVYLVCDLNGNPLTDGDAKPANPVRPAPKTPRKRTTPGNTLETVRNAFAYPWVMRESGRWVSGKFGGNYAVKITQSKGRWVLAISKRDIERLTVAHDDTNLFTLSEREREVTFSSTTIQGIVEFLESTI